MPNYRNIIKNSSRITLPTSDGDLHVDYYPARISQKMILEFEDFKDLDENETDKDALTQSFRHINTLIISLIKEWNLEEGDVPFPLDPDRMMELPIDLVQELTKAILRSARPNVTETQNGKFTN